MTKSPNTSNKKASQALAFECPTCKAPPGTSCDPKGRLHDARRNLADKPLRPKRQAEQNSLHMTKWILRKRLGGRLEARCSHGIGHDLDSHGCDGCCQTAQCSCAIVTYNPDGFDHSVDYLEASFDGHDLITLRLSPWIDLEHSNLLGYDAAAQRVKETFAADGKQVQSTSLNTFNLNHETGRASYTIFTTWAKDGKTDAASVIVDAHNGGILGTQVTVPGGSKGSPLGLGPALWGSPLWWVAKRRFA